MNPFALFSVCLVAALAAPSVSLAQFAGWSPQPALQQLLQTPQQPQPQLAPQLGADPSTGAGQLSLAADPQRQLITPDLQNQVQALGAQLAAANRQIQFYQQQLAGQQQQQQQALAPQQQQAAPSQPLNQPLDLQLQQQQQLQAQLQQQQQLQAALAAQQQQLAIQQQQQQQQQPGAQFAPSQAAQQPQFNSLASPFGGALGQQPQQAPQPPQAQFPSAQPQFGQQQPQTLVDNSATSQLASDPRLAGQPSFFAPQQQQQLALQQAQQQQAQQQQQQLLQQAQQFDPSRSGQQVAPTTSSSVEPASIEPSLAAQQPTAPAQPQAQQPQLPTSHAPVHTGGAKNEDKFSIGLGVLSPGYTQKFGNTALDFNQDSKGFSFTLSNNGHSNQPPPQPTTERPASVAAQK